ncbi:MAG: glutathione S-transferase family protein [Polyangiaceae bacterium]
MPTLYFAPMSSASPIVWAMAELGIEHEAVELDLRHDDRHRGAEFRALNPMGQVPVLVDDGQPMFESSAIIVYLGERYGVERGLWPEVGSREHMVALTWTMWTGVTLQRTVAQILATSSAFAPAELQHPGHEAAARVRFDELLDVVGAQLEGKDHLVGPAFTLADAYAAATLGWATRTLAVDPGTTPNLGSWLKRCLGREAAGTMV